MSDLEQSLDAGSSVDTGGPSEGISVSEGAAQLVSEREVTPSETPPEIVDYLDERGDQADTRRGVSATPALERS